MASSIVAGVMNLYDSIPDAAFGGTRPNIYMGEGAVTTSLSAQQRVPLVVLNDMGFRPDFYGENVGIEVGELRIEVFAQKLAIVPGATEEVTVDSIVAAIKWGGAPPGLKQGLDRGTVTLAGYNYVVHLLRKSEQRSYAGFDYLGARVHKCELRYACTLGLKAG